MSEQNPNKRVSFLFLFFLSTLRIVGTTLVFSTKNLIGTVLLCPLVCSGCCSRSRLTLHCHHSTWHCLEPPRSSETRGSSTRRASICGPVSCLASAIHCRRSLHRVCRCLSRHMSDAQFRTAHAPFFCLGVDCLKLSRCTHSCPPTCLVRVLAAA